MLWLEMSRDEAHGGGDWGFTKCLWSPSRKTDGSKWSFWESLLSVKDGDDVLHLRGAGKHAEFVGTSIAKSARFETTDRPPDAGQWGYSGSYYRANLRNFTPLEIPINLRELFAAEGARLREYFEANRTSKNKRRLFYVIQAGRLQCLNGACLSEVDAELAGILLADAGSSSAAGSNGNGLRRVATGEQVRTLLARVGQSEFSAKVRQNYGSSCCFPECEVREDRFLIGAHIARWADEISYHGDVSNGLCLCLMHDRAFELGLFTLSFDCRIWVNLNLVGKSPWATANLLPHHGKPIKQAGIKPAEEAIFRHWERVGTLPEF